MSLDYIKSNIRAPQNLTLAAGEASTADVHEGVDETAAIDPKLPAAC
ncbi:hypothetical protein [Congregibacter sp.]